MSRGVASGSLFASVQGATSVSRAKHHFPNGTRGAVGVAHRGVDSSGLHQFHCVALKHSAKPNTKLVHVEVLR